MLLITHDQGVVNYLCDREISLAHEQQGSKVINANKRIVEIDSEIILSVRNLGFVHRFGGLINKAGAHIQRITFSIRRGECIGIIGESGSGKSTLAHMLVGLLHPIEGMLDLHGKIIDFSQRKDIRSLREKVQLVMQDGRGSLHPSMTIRTLLQEIVDNQLESRTGGNVNLIDALAEVGLGADILDRVPGNLSGGECLRLNIARTLLMKSEVLICDESTSALDATTTSGIINLLKLLMKERGLSLILISHDSELIMELADKILIFDQGMIVEEAKPIDLPAKAEHAATKRIFTAQATLSQKLSH
ncbi:MAG: dipeptide/oligopeptide/nickel ABC transporter ATP-binding protein [Bacteroidota bacterium]|nr:dipeptide/oligopeptide/nickel ABC transporter ATP-binding protein [Bacteroidota bacterium]